MKFYKKEDKEMLFNENNSPKNEEPYRTAFSRDYARVLHSPAFRRLVGKTQLFPSDESDFFRNRMTHSLEVSQIARAITRMLNHKESIDIDEDLVSLASLAHDIGHPPFGHQGEEALNDCMSDHGGFEGNAQTLRILTKIEKKIYSPKEPTGITDTGVDIRQGLNLTPRAIASIIKYDNQIPQKLAKREVNGHEITEIKKGFYETEEEIVKQLKERLLGPNSTQKLKTVECSIMDVADDIAYSNYDLEDAFKAGFLSPMDLLAPNDELLERVVQSVNSRNSFNITAKEINEILISIYGTIFEQNNSKDSVQFKGESIQDFILHYAGNAYRNSKMMAQHGALRTQLTSKMVGKFIRGVEINIDSKNPALSRVSLREDILKQVEILKTFTYELQILSPKLKIVEIRGKEIVKKIFNTLLKKGNDHLLPEDYRVLYHRISKKQKRRILCDYIAGMTNRYAIQFYGRLTSENPETIFKPL